MAVQRMKMTLEYPIEGVEEGAFDDNVGQAVGDWVIESVRYASGTAYLTLTGEVHISLARSADGTLCVSPVGRCIHGRPLSGECGQCSGRLAPS